MGVNYAFFVMPFLTVYHVVDTGLGSFDDVLWTICYLCNNDNNKNTKNRVIMFSHVSNSVVLKKWMDVLVCFLR